jgi:hypothetical protein
MNVGNLARVIAVLGACAAAAGSATSRSSSSQNDPSLASQGGPGGQNSPPPPQQMEPDRALGLWRSTFGAVKIEPDGSHGGLAAGSVQGIWMYQRQGQDVVGYFAGNLRGNVLEFHWQEPNNPPLTGEGFLVFDVQGRQYAGRWWSDKRDRIGDWNGWRQPASQGARSGGDPGQEGQGDGYAQPQAPYRRQPYPRRPQPYQQQPYQQQPYQQQPAQQPAQQPPQPQQQPTYYN